MAVVCISNQVIDLCEPDITTCECTDDDYSILVEQTDVTQFQISLTEVDGVELVTDGGFATGCGAGNWTCSAAWNIAAGLASVTAGGGADILEQTLASLDLDTYYRITFDHFNPNAASNQLDVLFGGNNIAASINIPSPSSSITLYWYLDSKSNDKIEFSALGTFDIDNVSIKKISLPDDFTIKDDTGATVYTFSYTSITQGNISTYGEKSSHTLTDSVAVKATMSTVETDTVIALVWQNLGLSAGCYTVCVSTFESRPFGLQTTHTCSLQFSFTNSVNTFGLNYEDLSGFIQYLRVDARLRTPRYQYNERIFEDDSGSNTLTYANKTKIYNLDTEPLPRDLHTALCLGMLHDDFQIEGVRFVREPGDYSPGWSKNYVLSPFQGEVKKASQPNQVNRLC